MRLNVRSTGKNYRNSGLTTHEGGPAYSISDENQLRRSVMACMLWEDGFYETGHTVAQRIAALVPKVKPETVAQMAIDARTKMYLRHVPLYLVREMVRHESHRPHVRATLATVIQRADELTEFLAIYWAGGDRQKTKDKLPKSVQRGLADAFTKFSAYQLAKYNRDSVIKLRDVLFLSHAKPKNKAQGKEWTQLVDGKLPSPDTWEVAITACGADKAKKKAEWTRLLTENKVGGFALIRNLRNLTQSEVSDKLIRRSLEDAKSDKILPFRFLAALRYNAGFASELESMMLRNLADMDPLEGTTVVLVDESKSMDEKISDKSEMTRFDAACGVAVAARELCSSCRVFGFSTTHREVKAYRGLALAEQLGSYRVSAATYLGKAMKWIDANIEYDRVIVITDEQAQDAVKAPKGKGYVINVATNANGVGYGEWNHIDGWSDRVLDYIRVLEATSEEAVGA